MVEEQDESGCFVRIWVVILIFTVLFLSIELKKLKVRIERLEKQTFIEEIKQ